jgi:hypothetical protein
MMADVSGGLIAAPRSQPILLPNPIQVGNSLQRCAMIHRALRSRQASSNPPYAHSPDRTATSASGKRKATLSARGTLPRALAALVLGVLCWMSTGCGEGKRAPTQRDVNVIAAAMSDVVYQCQSVAAGYLAGADSNSLRRDVDALLDAYRRLRADATIAIGAPPRLTLRRELVLAEANLRSGCSGREARRIAAAVGPR